MPYPIYIFVAFAGTAIPILGTMIVSIYLSRQCYTCIIIYGWEMVKVVDI